LAPADAFALEVNGGDLSRQCGRRCYETPNETDSNEGMRYLHFSLRRSVATHLSSSNERQRPNKAAVQDDKAPTFENPLRIKIFPP
jgi:hypothetical protein